MASLGGPARQGVGIAGRVDAAGIGSDQHQRGHRADRRIGKRGEPASSQPGVTSVSLLRSWMNCPRAAAMPALAAAQKPRFRLEPHHADLRISRAASQSAVPSVEPSSTTMTSIGQGRSRGRCRSTLARQVASRSRPL